MADRYGLSRVWVMAAVLVSAVTVSAVPASAQATRPATHPAATQSRIERKTYVFKFEQIEREMEYALFVPSGYDKARKTPLLVALHGLLSNPQQIMRYPGLTDLAERYGYIVVAPMGFNNHGWYGAKPLVGVKGDDPKNLPELSEKDVLNVLAIVRDEYNVDPDRIYLMGHSMGGGGCWELAIRHPDLFAALAPIAPATVRPAEDLQKIKHIPVVLVQGGMDLLVPVRRVQPWAEQMKKLEMSHEYIEVPTGDHVGIAFTEMPKIFAFLDKQRRQPAK
jgi:poly(3-hydroxybutyrate) depolymerase